MPKLFPDGTIEFASGAEFLSEYEENLARNGLFVQTDIELPMRIKRTFTMVVRDAGVAISMVAEPVFCSAGMMGLEVSLDPTTEGEIKALVQQLAAAAAAAPPPPAPGPASAVAPASPHESDPAAAPADDPAASTSKTWPPGDSMAGGQGVTPLPPLEPSWDVGASTPTPMTMEPPPGSPTWDVGDSTPTPMTMEPPPGVPTWDVGAPTPTPMTIEPPPGAPTWDVGAPTPTPVFIPPGADVAGNGLPAMGTRPLAASMPQLNINGIATAGKESGEFGEMKIKAIDPDALAEIPLFHLLGSIAMANLPLSLRIRLGHEQLIFDFNLKGKLVRFARPGSPMDLLERLEDSGKLDRKTKMRVLATLGDAVTTQGIVKLLVMRRLLRAQDYWLAVRAQAIDSLNQVRRLGRCPFSLHTEVITRHNGISFGSLLVPWMDVALREQTNDDQEAILGDQWHRYPMLTQDPIWPLHALGLDHQAQGLFEEVLDGCMTLDHVRKISSLGLKRTRRLFITFISIGLLKLNDLPASDGVVLTAEEIVRAELDKRRASNRFDQLGVHWSEHWSAFDAALAKVKKEFGDESKWYVFHEETVPICRQIVKLAGEASVFLKRKDNRLKERDLMASQFQRKVAGYLLFKQAELMVMRKEYRAARMNLEVALEMEPGNRDYLDLLRRC